MRPHVLKPRHLFAQWLSQHKGLMLKVVRGYAFTDADRDDVFQEVATQLWTSIPSFHHVLGTDLDENAIEQQVRRSVEATERDTKLFEFATARPSGRMGSDAIQLADDLPAEKAGVSWLEREFSWSRR